jgi:hypothetical protein
MSVLWEHVRSGHLRHGATPVFVTKNEENGE